ncbi:MAG: hypothetical protein A2X48_09160 [Lentisphaerae bacterium GWF2_49_21]|nr:MAG: hypothetical protein A2X48_09160 [Lentisphaerae bacterium GWF2_49_21]
MEVSTHCSKPYSAIPERTCDMKFSMVTVAISDIIAIFALRFVTILGRYPLPSSIFLTDILKGSLTPWWLFKTLDMVAMETLAS